MSMWMIFRRPVVPTTADGSGICGSRIILAAGRDYPESAVGKRTLQRVRLVPRSAHPHVVFLDSREDDRHRLRMNATDFHIWFTGQEGIDVGGDFSLPRFPDASPIGPEPGEAQQWPTFVRGKPDRRLLAVDSVVLGK